MSGLFRPNRVQRGCIQSEGLQNCWRHLGCLDWTLDYASSNVEIRNDRSDIGIAETEAAVFGVFLARRRVDRTGRLMDDEFILKAALAAGLCLVGFDQVADALRIALVVAVTGDRVGSAGRFDHDLGPEHAGRDVNGSNLRNRDALLVTAEKPSLNA